MKTHRGTILKVIALLIAGATLNVAVAWGFCWRAISTVTYDPRGHASRLTAEEQQLITMTKLEEESSILSWFEWTTTGVQIRCAAQVPELWLQLDLLEEMGRFSPKGEQVRAGFPVLALEGWTNFDGSPRSSFAVRLDSLAYKGNWPEPALPLRPLCPGFAVNTLFYAGVLWVLFCGPFALRRMIRRRRGQCPRCAYPIDTSKVCTECGAAVIQH